MRRNAARWITPLGSFVSRYTVARLAAETGVSPFAVHKWVSGENAPRPAHAMRIVELSGGAISLEEVYRQREEVGVDRGRE